MKKSKINFIRIGFILCFLAILYNYFFKNILQGTKYGKAANVIREHAKVPVIEPNMRKININGGGKWEGKVAENGLIHFWKIVSPNTGKYKLDEETDMFRKYINSETYWQLNMRSKILGDSVSTRKGTIRFYDKVLINEYDLGDNGLDSLFRSWWLDYLVKK